MRRVLLALPLVGIAPLALGSPLAHVLNTNQTIHLVNAATNNEVLFNNTTFPSDSLARSLSGQLYSADPNGNLWDVTGPPIPVGPTGRTQIGDLDFAAGGLWGFSNASSELFFFDLGTTSVTYSAVITNIPSAFTVTGVAHDASTGDIYLSANNGLNLDRLLLVPNAATTATLIGAMTIGDAFSYIADIDFSGGTLYGVTFFHRYFYTISTSTAATSLVSVGPHRDVTAMALDPVPEPATLAGLLAGSLWLRRTRRRREP